MVSDVYMKASLSSYVSTAKMPFNHNPRIRRARKLARGLFGTVEIYQPVVVTKIIIVLL